ncbi:MAG: hypothetical protein LWX54_04525 [Deltaproteobacteria bacterium]|jgi:hypothetical protein|nr:hypothetical protein [Deltaproteobacteria bacterium]
MDVVLTSFGMGMKERGHGSFFHRMPPLYLGERDGRFRFHIDYASLFMFDRVIVDERSYERALAADIGADETRWMSPNMLEAVKQGAAEYAEVLTKLQASGRLLTKDFDGIVAKSGDLLGKVTAADMKDMLRWRRPLESAVLEWSSVNQRLRGELIYDWRDPPPLEIDKEEYDALCMLAHSLSAIGISAYHIVEVLKRWKKKQSPRMREMCRELLRDYLSYTNSNLIISFDCQAPFIDWMDMRHFYEEKFHAAKQSMATTYQSQEVVTGSRRLFDFLFPYFMPKSPTELLRGVNDSRTDKLRGFVKDAVNQGVEFDSRECIDILKDILSLEQKAILQRKISGWVTLPLGFIPIIGTPIQKGVEELVNSLWSNRSTDEYSWFYLINELDVSTVTRADRSRRRAEQSDATVG